LATANLILQFSSEDAMQESVIYQDILQKGQQQGKEQGQQEEAFRFLMLQLNRRFGEIDASIIERIQVLSTEQLEILGEESIDFSAISDLLTLLEQQESN
jgi:predicted transposase YdaD